MKKNRRKNPLVIIVLLLLLAGMGFLGYNLFNITAINVTGNIEKTKDYIIRLSGVETGTNIFKIDDNVLKQNIEKDPYLKFIQVKKNYPDKIIIEVKERVPVALVTGGNSTLLLDEEGYVLQMPKDTNGLAYPLVSGIDVSNSVLGKQVKFADEAQRLALQTIMQELYKNGMNTRITGIDLLNINNIKMSTANGIAVIFGNYDKSDKKMLWTKSVLDYFEKEGIKEGAIDVSTGQFATYQAGQK